MALHEYQKHMYKKVGVIVALIVLPIAGFFAGMNYAQQMGPTTQNGTANGPTLGPHILTGGTIGTVKSISATNITVIQGRNNEEKTYTLTSSTTYKNGDANARASDVKTGDTVLLTLDSSDNTKVTTVTLNPPMFRSGPERGGDMMIQ